MKTTSHSNPHMKHTPGSWNYAQLPNIKTPHFQICNENGECIAEVYEQNSDWPTEANACLIAAAPELLEALEKAHKMMLSYQGILGSTPLTEEEHAMFYEVEHAINKAKNKSL